MSKAMHAKPFRLTGPYTARHARPESPRSKLIRVVSLGLACVCLLLTATVYPASAATNSTSMASLQTKLDKLSQSINQHKKELSDAKKKESAAKALESELKERVTVLQDQISVLGGQIAAVQNSIGEKEQQIGVMQTQITDKQTQIEQKQNEIDGQWDDFKKHMAAMQELRDGGSVAMLSAVNDLYELLTFNEVMQDISIKDTEIMNNMKSAKQELEDDKAALEEQKAGLEAERAELQSQKSELDSQNAQMKGKQSELSNSISAAKLSAAEAQAAQQKAQAAIESDELNYEAVKKEIQKMIAAASASKPQLSFSGFACPLKSYSRISSEYGWRKNPVSGVNKLHAALAVHENVQAKQVKPVAGQQLRFQFLCRGKCSDMMFDFQVGEDFAAQCRRFLPRILLIFADRHCIHRSSPPGDQIDFSTDFIFLQQSRLFGHFKHRRISAQATWSNGD